MGAVELGRPVRDTRPACRGGRRRNHRERLVNNPAPNLSDFGHDPLWLSIIKALFIFVFLMVGVLLGVWTERKLISRMQHRYGPNRAGKFGLLQSVADGLKMGLK